MTLLGVKPDPTISKDVVFVALDSEFESTRIRTSTTNCKYENIIRQMGFARLDNRLLAEQLATCDNNSIASLVTAEQISIEEDPKRAYLNLVRGKREKNTFGNYYSVPEVEFDPQQLVTEVSRLVNLPPKYCLTSCDKMKTRAISQSMCWDALSTSQNFALFQSDIEADYSC